MVTIELYDIRPLALANARSLAEVHVNSWMETYANLLPNEILGSQSSVQRTEMWTRILENQGPESVCLGAWDGDQLIGFLHGGPARAPFDKNDREVYSLYILKSAQGRGYGLRLLNTFIHLCRVDGKHNAYLRMLAGNPADTFYTRNGWKRGPECDSALNGIAIKEYSYAFEL